MDSVTLSVCLNTYNHFKYINQAIDSILMQKVNFTWEIIIADDFSTDGTREIIFDYWNKYKNLIRIIDRNKNVGAQQNGYELLKNSSAKYIAYLEGDDFWTDSNKLQKQVNFLEENTDYGLVWTDIDMLYEKSGRYQKEVFKNKKLPIYDTIEEVLINKPFFSPLTWVYRREVLPAKIYNYSDGTFPMIMDIMAKSKIKHLPEVTATYRVMEESASHSKSLAKRYKFLKGVHSIQIDYLKKYKFTKLTADIVLARHYLAAYPYAVILGDNEAIKKGKIIIKNSQNIGLKVKTIFLLSNNSIGINILRFIYNNDLLKKIISTFIK